MRLRDSLRPLALFARHHRGQRGEQDNVDHADHRGDAEHPADADQVASGAFRAALHQVVVGAVELVPDEAGPGGCFPLIPVLGTNIASGLDEPLNCSGLSGLGLLVMPLL